MEQIDQNVIPKSNSQEIPNQPSLDQVNSTESIPIDPKPWGFWATAGFAICIIVGLNLIVNFIIGLVIGVAAGIHAGANAKTEAMNTYKTFVQSGSYVVILGLISFPFQVGLTLYFAKLRKQIPVRQYLGLQPVNIKTFFKWSLVILAVAVLPKLIFLPLMKEAISQSWQVLIHAYRTTFSVPLFWLLFCVLLPISEEILFRGFIFEGFLHTRLGFVWTNILTSFAWTLLHSYYPLSGMVYIFLVGLLFGYARFKTNSIYTSMVMHVINNVVGIITLVLVAK